VPAVTSTSSIGQDQLRIDGQTLTVNGIDPATVTGAYRYEWAARSSEQSRRDLGANGAIVDQSFATSHHLTVGSEIDARLAAGGSPHLVVRGIDVPPKWGALGLGPITISTATFRSAFPLGRDRLTFVNVAQPDPRTLALLRAKVEGYPGVKVMTPATFAKSQLACVDQTLAIISVLLALAVIVSLLGIVNTLALSVIERTRELGMLRAVGMTRRQARRMIRHEGVITALLGATLGIAVGTFLAALVTVALRDQGTQFAVPVGSIVAFVVIAVAAGILAAVGPARRASRLRPLVALAYE
jgi:putative ABC transport system permease protein